MNRFTSVDAWLDDMRNTVKSDLDNLILFTGEEGAGKSTVMYQIMKALDPTFNVDRIHFTIPDFINAGRTTPRKGGARALDELLANKRKAMYGETIALLEHLQKCRYLNHHMAMCFPRERRLDEAILNDRVRWHVQVPRRGLFLVRKKTEIKKRTRWGEERVYFRWDEWGRWAYEKNTGPEWRAYLQKKETHGRETDEENVTTSPDGVDKSRIEALFRAGLLEYEKNAPPGSAIHEMP